MDAEQFFSIRASWHGLRRVRRSSLISYTSHKVSLYRSWIQIVSWHPWRTTPLTIFINGTRQSLLVDYVSPVHCNPTAFLKIQHLAAPTTRTPTQPIRPPALTVPWSSSRGRRLREFYPSPFPRASRRRNWRWSLLQSKCPCQP